VESEGLRTEYRGVILSEAKELKMKNEKKSKYKTIKSKYKKNTIS
jgi:hypothetical protein